MAMSCEQVDAQMLDFLYGELSVEDRSAFQAHLPGCERCQREVVAFGRTRTLARAALDQTEAPPARVRANILRAAQEQAARANVMAAVPAQPTQAPAPKVIPARASFWDWIRARWAFPTLATVGALSVFVLGSRLFLTPQPIRPSPTATSDQSPRSESAPMAPPPTDDRDEMRAKPRPPGTAPVSAVRRRSSPSPLPSSGAAVSASRTAPAKGGASASALRGAAAADGYGALGGGAPGKNVSAEKKRSFAPPPPPRAEAVEENAKSDRASERESDRASEREPERRVLNRADRPNAPSAPITPSAASASRAPSAEGGIMAVDDVALDKALPARSPSAAPSARAAWPAYRAPGAAPREAAKETAKAERKAESSVDDGARSSAAGPAPQPAREQQAQSRAKASVARAPAFATPEPAHAETLVQRADRLFAAGRWVEAAAAYRDLLRANPDGVDAPRWRRRLAAAQAATPSAPAPVRP